jgi:hypothetical protein
MSEPSHTFDASWFQAKGTEFASVSDERRLALHRSFRDKEAERHAVWKYYHTFDEFFASGGDEHYTEEQLNRDLAILVMMGDRDIDPRDVTFAVDQILHRAGKLSRDAVRMCYKRAAEIASRLGFGYLAQRIADYPSTVWRDRSASQQEIGR